MKKNKILNFFDKKTTYFTNYEKFWLFGLGFFAVILAIIFPEETVNGVDGRIITILYLLDTILAMVCELLTSKQSKLSFIIYVFVEFIEIGTLAILGYRFASMAIALLFWLPMHIVSYINWYKHPDKIEKEKTVVRQLNWWQTVILIVLCALWTLGVGYLMARFMPDTDFLSNDLIIKIIAYMDACASAISIINGILVLFRYKEAWTTWYVFLAIETAINIMSGQWILLVLKFGYLTNTTYGLIKWQNYIKNSQLNTNELEQKEVENI